MIDTKKAERAVRERLPRSRWLRILIGLLLLLGGLVGFLPILGFWMVPLGLLVLSYDLASARRLRRRLAVWWYGRGGNGANGRRSHGNREKGQERPDAPDQGAPS